VARRHGDYAVCGLAAVVTVTDGVVSAARAAYVSVAPTPLVLDLTEAVAGAEPGVADWAAAGDLAWQQADPGAGHPCQRRLPRHLVRVLTARALAQAAGRAAA
jgi:carbon-monoxide dehydrogenase medium subunit